MNRLGKHLAIWGTLLQLGIVVGFAVSLVAMGRAMSVFTPRGLPPLEVTSVIQASFHVVTIGLIMAIVGGVVTLAALFGCRYRAPWLHSVLCVQSLCWLAVVPPLGLAMIAYLIFDRKSFLRPADSLGERTGDV